MKEKEEKSELNGVVVDGERTKYKDKNFATDAGMIQLKTDR